MVAQQPQLPDLRPTKYARPTAEQILRLILDAGNLDIKLMLLDAYTEALVFAHAVAFLTREQYDRLSPDYSRAAGVLDNSVLFSFTTADGKAKETHYVLVGNHARQFTDTIRRQGADKYGVYYTSIALAALLLIHPRSSEVNVVAMHPTGADTYQRESLANSLKGRFNIVLPNGAKLTYTLTNPTLIPEGRAAIQNFMLTQEATLYERVKTQFADLRGLSFDGGGFISGITPFSVNAKGRIDVNAAASKPMPNVGIAPIFETLSDTLRKMFPQQLGSLATISEELLQQALLHDKVKIQGRWHTTAANDSSWTIAQAVENAVKPTMSTIKAFIHTHYRGATDIDYVLITGGGGGLLYRFLVKYVFDGFEAENVHLCAARNVEPTAEALYAGAMISRFDAVMGASKGYKIFLAVKEKATKPNG